ncbi:hypothetical protein [Ruegeria halocynthiae]|uniref:hypothetical protein n=1 Tax=Ruegeria halocynthiae TaxID=985054 RepID=UPI000564AC74|nr:hypothetical protein [Ruegeria halocynthiae]
MSVRKVNRKVLQDLSLGLDENLVSKIVDAIDYDDVEAWSSDNFGREIILKLLKSDNIEAFELGGYAFRQGSGSDMELFDDVVEVLRDTRIDGRLLFSSIALQFGYWRKEYSDMALISLADSGSMSRINIISLLYIHGNPALIHILDYLNERFGFQLSCDNLVDQYKSFETTNPLGTLGTSCVDDGLAERLSFVQTRGLLRGLCISQLMREVELFKVHEVCRGEAIESLDQLESMKSLYPVR